MDADRTELARVKPGHSTSLCGIEGWKFPPVSLKQRDVAAPVYVHYGLTAR